MPIYEYFCHSCDHEFEEIIFGDELPECPKCHAEKCQKLISRPSKRRSGTASSEFDNAAQAMPSRPSAGKCSGCSGGNCAAC